MAGEFGITGTIVGLKECQEALRQLPGKLQRRILRPAMTKATKPILMAVKRLAPRDTGMLRKSITRKVVTYKSGTLVAVIGPDTKHRVEATRRGRSKPMVVNPAKYAHLVEFGTRPHSLTKGDKLKRSGPGAQKALDRSIANVRRWAQQMATATPEQQVKLQAKIDRSRRLAAMNQKEQQSTGGAQHPGAKAQPFIRPAYDTTRLQVQQIFAQEIAANIQKLAQKGLIKRA